jgi:hypothetical protein
MEWLIASLVALLDEAAPKPTGQFKEFLDERALGLATMLAESRAELTRAADAVAESMVGDAELMASMSEEINALNREIVEVMARNVVLQENITRLEEQHKADRAHIRELIAEMVRRDVR